MVYLDNAANAPVFPEVLEAMLPWLRPDHVGNPGSLHTQGVNAREAVENARRQVAKMIGADPSEVFFTSGGTEFEQCVVAKLWRRLDFNNCSGTRFGSGTYVCALSSPLYQSPQKDGSVDLNDLERFLSDAHTAESNYLPRDGRSTAVSIMWVNNELGTVNPIKETGTLCKRYHAVFHADAVQAAGHVNMNVKDCGIDFCSMSGHKFGAPLGVGVLYISNSLRKSPWIIGGGQENGMRGGTENVPGIVGIGKAAEIVTERLQNWKLRWGLLRDTFLTDLGLRMPGEFYINGDSENYSSNIISLTIPGVNSESLLLLLDQLDIYLSAGSACSAASAKSSHVLRGIGMSDEDASCTVRISIGVQCRCLMRCTKRQRLS